MAQADYILEKVEKVQHIAHQVQSKTLEVYQDSFKEYSPFSFMRKVFWISIMKLFIFFQD